MKREMLSKSLVGLGAILLVSTLAMTAIERRGATGQDDPSLPSGPPIIGDLADDLTPAMEGAFEGPAGSVDPGQNIVIPQGQEDLHGINIPTGLDASPLFGAEPFTQTMIRFEEFGRFALPETYTEGDPVPTPADENSMPDSADVDAFLEQSIFPEPTEFANDADENPWKTQIEDYLGRTLDSPPAEGRPPGEGWAHQRWAEFAPEIYFHTAQTGARPNGGMRDDVQMHDYTTGEFGPGGLYHNTAGAVGFDGSCNGLEVRFHPDMPEQLPESIWTFDGTLPPKLLMARYGEPILFRHYNFLPISPAANRGFGLHTITTHEHNGHNPAESDGYTNAFFFPGQYYDYRWPMILAGHDSINTDASDPKAAMPTADGGTVQIPGDYRETMSTHWFHDHMLDFTAQNVYKGNAAMMNYYSAIDRGNEEIDDGVNLRLPSGTDLGWGNRDYDVNLLIADKAWDSDGQLFFNIFNLDGFLGDQILTNWLWKPTFEVRARRYRFRLLNGSVSRYYRLALATEDGTPVPFHMIANDGNIMEHAVYFENGRLPTQAIAERYDIIVDFAGFAPGTKLYFVNLLEHDDGRRPEEAVPLADVFSGAYNPTIVGNEWVGGDPCVGKFLELEVVAYDGEDLSMNPADYEETLPTGEPGLKMIPLPVITQEELDNAKHRTFSFGRSSGTDDAPWTVKTDGGDGFTMDPRRLSAAPTLGDVEIWHIENGGGGWSHPIHIHFEEAQIYQRDGVAPPSYERWARKDVFRVGRMEDSGDSVDIVLRFRDFAGTYVEHCHNTQHEDHAMLLRWDIENPGQFSVIPTPIPTWDGVTYVDSVALTTFRTGDEDAAADEHNFRHLAGDGGVVDPPVEDPPVEDPPAEDPPAEDPPAEDPPAEDPPAEDPPAADPVTLIDEDFAGGVGDFTHAADVFGTTGTFGDQLNGWWKTGSLRIKLQSGTDISSAWEAPFTLDAAADVTIAFDLKLDLINWPAGQLGEALLAIDGEIVEVLASDTASNNFGYQSFSVTVSLEAGAHTLSIGGRAADLSGTSARLKIELDNVSVVANAGAPADPPAEDPPAEDPPAEDPPAEDPPAEDPPAEDPPAEDPPAEDPPAEDPPADAVDSISLTLVRYNADRERWIVKGTVDVQDGQTISAYLGGADGEFIGSIVVDGSTFKIRVDLTGPDGLAEGAPTTVTVISTLGATTSGDIEITGI